MATKFFKGDTPHSRVKRIMYKKYLQAFIPSTQQSETYSGKPFTTVIIDGFAGAGRYDSSRPSEIDSYGSPLIALMVTLNYFYRKMYGGDQTPIMDQRNRDTLSIDMDDTYIHLEPRVYFYFIESSSKCFRNLVDNVTGAFDGFLPNADSSYDIEEGSTTYRFRSKHPSYPVVCTLINQQFENFQPPDEIKDPSAACLLFLDPCGYSQFPMSAVKAYIGPGNSVLINFMSSYVNRFLESKEEVIRKLYGKEYLIKKMRDPDKALQSYLLLRQYESDGNPLDHISSCAANYEESLKRIFKCEYSLTFEIRGRNNCIIYHLIFITGNKKGLAKMKESMNRCSQVEGTFSMSDYLFYRNGCLLNLANTQDNEVIAEAIYNKFKGRTKVEISEVKDYVLLHTPYLFRKKPLKLMVKEENPRIKEVVDSDGNCPRRKGTFPDYQKWFMSFRE